MSTPSNAEPIEVPTPEHEPVHEPVREDEADNYGIEEAQANHQTNEPVMQDSQKKASKEANSIVAIIALIFMFIAFVLTVIATPLDALRHKDPNSFLLDSRQRGCYSMWGYKRCGAHKVVKSFNVNGHKVTLPNSGYECDSWKPRMRAAASFAIISIFFTLVALIFVILAVFRVLKGVFAGIFGIIAAIMLVIPWACVLGVYYINCNDTFVGSGIVIVGQSRKSKSRYHLGAAFAMMVAAMCMEIFGAIVAFFA